MPPVSAARPGWFARCFGPARSRSAPTRPPRRAESGKLFTRKAYANLPPDVRAILNTPLEDCDPALVRLLFAALAQEIAACLPPEAEMTAAQKMYAGLWGDLIAKLAECGLDDAPAEPPPEDDAATALSSAASEPSPESSAPAGAASVFHRGPVSFVAGRAFRQCRRALLQHCAWAFRSLGPPAGRFLPRQQPPPRRLCYAACAGPP
ncbi:MAG TPA: hypothetical protein VFN42_11435 [Acetobacteraceae bacterium]|nr:hypothetical protein [Acetobacteraceae bacterium]